MITLESINEHLESSGPLLHELQDTLDQLPATSCQRKVLCCSMLPEMTAVEALSAFKSLASLNPSVRLDLIQKIIRYFLINPVEIAMCPFLRETECLIYASRFFGCRAYGLWSRAHYENIAEQSRDAKKTLQRQWENLGVSLPDEVVNYQVPYCMDVEIQGNIEINDDMLVNTASKIHNLSQQLGQWHQMFTGQFFSDLSFLTASMVYGMREAVRLKFEIVREIRQTGDRSRLNSIIQEPPDFLAG